MPNKKNLLCNIAISNSTVFSNHWALHLTPRGDKKEEEVVIQCQFPEHKMMTENTMNDMMESLAHRMAEAFRQHNEQEREKKENAKEALQRVKNERIAKKVVGDFFKRARQN